MFDLSILWFAAGYIVLDVLASSLTGVVMASLVDRSTGAIVAVVLDHASGAILGFALGGRAPQTPVGRLRKLGPLRRHGRAKGPVESGGEEGRSRDPCWCRPSIDDKTGAKKKA